MTAASLNPHHSIVSWTIIGDVYLTAITQLHIMYYLLLLVTEHVKVSCLRVSLPEDCISSEKRPSRHGSPAFTCLLSLRILPTRLTIFALPANVHVPQSRVGTHGKSDSCKTSPDSPGHLCLASFAAVFDCYYQLLL